MELNPFAVLVAAIAGFAVGGLWYSPVLFGNVWIRLMGFTPEKLEEMKQKGMAKTMAASFICQLVTAGVLSIFVKYPGVASVGMGILTAFLIWLGFVATVLLNSILFEGKPPKLYALNAGYQLTAFLVMGAILSLWL